MNQKLKEKLAEMAKKVRHRLPYPYKQPLDFWSQIRINLRVPVQFRAEIKYTQKKYIREKAQNYQFIHMK